MISDAIRNVSAAVGDVVKEIKFRPTPKLKPPRRRPRGKNKSQRSDYMQEYMQEYRQEGKGL